jgi:tetratricopeptide (TPR) repeat protein
MTRRATCLVAFMLVAASVVPMRAAKLGPEHVKALEGWLAMIDEHTPGRIDPALARVAALTYDQRQDLNDALPLFFNALFDRVSGVPDDAERRIVQLGERASKTPGARSFIVRAASLHGDAVIFRPRLVAPPPDPRDTNPADGRLVLASDGEYGGMLAAGWQGKFARDLLDRLPRSAADDPFVAQWYHAQAAYLISTRRYGEATPGLRRAAQLFPDDARVLFDRACLAEAMGLPRVAQVVMELGAGSAGRVSVGTGPAAGSVEFSETVVNTDAERLFRRVLEIEGSWAQARVRLGRLLLVRRRYAEADTELTRALAQTSDASSAYLAHLFASRACVHLGRLDEAAAHIDRALDLVPNAQSALLAKSQLALQRADIPGAVAPMARLAPGKDKRPTDPWMLYETGVGPAQAKTLLMDVWAAVTP